MHCVLYSLLNLVLPKESIKRTIKKGIIFSLSIPSIIILTTITNTIINYSKHAIIIISEYKYWFQHGHS